MSKIETNGLVGVPIQIIFSLVVDQKYDHPQSKSYVITITD